MSEERFVAIETKLDSLSAGQAQLASRFNDMHRSMDKMHEDIDELHRHMLVLHEETLDSIRALAPDPEPIRREFTKADKDLRNEIDARLTPLEAAIRRPKRR